MSGHSKWSNIKRKKEANDKVKSKQITKISRLITMSVLENNGVTNPDNNFKLRLAIDQAHQANMPKDSIVRAIEKGSGDNKINLKEMIYEAYAPHGVALIIYATTDNSNRTSSEIKTKLERGGGKLVSQGAVSYLFRRCAMIMLDKTKYNDTITLSLVEKLGAFDIKEDEINTIIYFPFMNIHKFNDLQVIYQIKTTADLYYQPLTTVFLDKSEDINSVVDVISSLEELDDVHIVFANYV